MEQLRSFLDAVKKYHFWILCGLACLVGLVMYYVSSNGLIKTYEAKKTTISGVENGIRTVANGSQLPNENWVDFGRKKTEEYRKKIFAAWTKLYDQQKATVYVWPKELGAAFVKAFSNDSPKNVIPKDDLDEYRQNYQNFVVQSGLPALAASVNAEWVAVHEEGENKAAAPRSNPRGDRSRAFGSGRPGPQKVESASSVNHPCVWEASDQQRWVELFTWDPDPPTEVEIRFAQEDQWVLKALFDSIARANNGAQVSTDAVVRVIQEALVGIDANSQTPLGEGSGRIVHMRPAATLAPGAPTNGPGGSAGPLDAAGPAVPVFAPRQGRGGGRGNRGQQPGQRGGGRGGRGGPVAVPPPGGFGQADGQPGASTDPSEALKNFRYCDAKGKPLPASELANTNSPEYLLMPFRLVLVCDEARFPVIVAELANSPLPLEVREVRINAESEEKAQGRRDRGRSAPINPGNQGESGILHNATVEIWGMAYLISRPEPKKLGLSEAAPAPAAGDATAKPGDATAKPAADGPTPATGTIEPGKAPGSTTTTDATQTPPANGAATSGTLDKGTAKEAAPLDSAAPPATTPPTTTPDKAAPATEPPATK